jgi:hypothetical protein
MKFVRVLHWVMEKTARGASENAKYAFPAFPQPRRLLA